MITKKVFQLNTELHKVTGIQRVILDIHAALREIFDVRIVGNIPYEQVNDCLRISEADYLRFRHPFVFRNAVVIIHERRLLPLMWLLTHVPWLNIKCIYVHHNELYGNKRLSLFPKSIVAISDAGIKNLTAYFGVKRNRITKIHNCVRDTMPYKPRDRKFDPDHVTILYPARINSVKRQIEVVEYLKGKLDPRVRILFAGTGPQYSELEEICHGNCQFQVLGFRSDIESLMQQCDFMLLFSRHEGLPISLIEAAQSGLPAICNDVGGNTEIVKNGVNGIIVNEWSSLLAALNKLPDLKQAEIDKMSAEGRNIYLNHFHFGIFKENYRSLIKSLM